MGDCVSDQDRRNMGCCRKKGNDQKVDLEDVDTHALQEETTPDIPPEYKVGIWKPENVHHKHHPKNHSVNIIKTLFSREALWRHGIIKPVLTFLVGYWIVFLIGFFCFEESCVHAATMGPNIMVGEDACVYPTMLSCIETIEGTRNESGGEYTLDAAKPYCENPNITISTWTTEKFQIEVAGIAQMHASLTRILTFFLGFY